MNHLLEISRIIDGAIKGDKTKVYAYVEQLSRKLREDGDVQSADRLDKATRGGATADVQPAALSVVRRLPVDSESRLSLADESVVSADDVQIILEPAIQNRVDEFVRYVQESDKLLANSVGISPSMIIYGPPGVGKTELARHIASQLRLPLLTARADSLISSYLGSTAKNIRMLFEHAAARPCILFLDEFDSIAKLRDDQYEMGELKRVVVSLLQNIDSLNNQTILLAATNHHHLLDPAVWRRFTYKIEMDLPDNEVRLRLFSLFLGKHLADSEDLGLLADAADGINGAEIRHMCEDGIRTMILNDDEYVDINGLIRVIAPIRLGRSIDFSRHFAEDMQAVCGLANGITQKRVSEIFGISSVTRWRQSKQKEKVNA